MSDLWQDIRYGTRLLRKSPGFTTVAVLSLVLGIGANTAIFQLLDAVRLRTLPVKDPQEITLVKIRDMTGVRGNWGSPHPTVTNPVWERIRDEHQAFSGAFAWGASDFNLSQGGEARYARGLWVSGDFFNVLGVSPILGRVFTPEDDQRGCGSPITVISYAYWQSEFGGDPSVIGRSLSLKGRQFEIIGVTPAGFFGLEVGRSFDVAVPICSEALLWRAESRLDSGTDWWLTVMGRLKPGWTTEQATAHLNSISPGIFAATLARNYPRENVNDYLGFKLDAVPAGTGLSQLRQVYESPLWLMLALAGLVLLIACANLANLLLARASAREREIAIRLALGASRGRLARQLLAESLLLAAAGALGGALLAQNLSGLLVSLISSEGDGVLLELNPDWRVLIFIAGLAVLTCVLFGLAPALRATRLAPSSAMQTGGRSFTGGRERLSLRRMLVVSQVTLSFVLLAGALLFSRSLGNLVSLDAGFRQNGILITSVALTRLQLPPERRPAAKRDLLERVRSIQGVESAADADIVPLSGNSWGNRVWPDGADSSGAKDSLFNRVSPRYFETLDTPIILGRDFSDTDTPASLRVAIVNASFARQVFNNDNPIGKRFWKEATPDGPATLFEIVGLVKDAKYNSLREDFSPVAYLAISQNARPGHFDQILIRSNASLSSLMSSVKSAIGEINPEILIDFQSFKTQIESSLLRERLMATLSGFFGVLAVLLACIGLYGVMSYGVAGRTKEIGIRMALGADRPKLLWLILREGLAMVVIGMAIGLPAVIAATGLVSSLLFGLSSTDPISISVAALLMLLVGTAAGYIPARRATRVDPLVSLRYE